MYSSEATQYSKQPTFLPFDLGPKVSAILLPTFIQLSEVDFSREGYDLILKFHDQTVVIDNYFTSPLPLVTAEGIKLAIDEIFSLINHQDNLLMLAENGTADVPVHSAQQKIGSVEMIVEGPITAQNQAGISRTLQQGDAVYLHDTLITPDRGYVKIILNDDSVFQLGPLSRATLDKYSYNADKPEAGGEFETSVFAGIFRFVSGKISGDDQGEHTTIKTPAANIGIRGSEIDGVVGSDGSTTILHTQGYVTVHPLYHHNFDIFEPGTTIYIPITAEVSLSVYHADHQQITQIRELLLPLNPEKGQFTVLEKESLSIAPPETRIMDDIGHHPPSNSLRPPELTEGAIRPFGEGDKMPLPNPTHGRPPPHIEFGEGGMRPIHEGLGKPFQPTDNHGERPHQGERFDREMPLRGESDREPSKREELPTPENPFPSNGVFPLPPGSGSEQPRPPGIPEIPKIEELVIRYSFNEDNSVIISGVLPFGSEKEEVEILSPRYGSVINNRDGSFTYTPFSGLSGDDSFSYRFIEENITLRSHPLVTINVHTDPLSIILPPKVSYNQPQHGDLVINNNDSLIYIPEENYHGFDNFIYSIEGKTASAEIQLTPVNDAPIAQSDVDPTLVTDEDTALTIRAELLLNNDSDPDGDRLSIHIRSSANSLVSVDPDGNLSYLPHPNFNGQDTFSYFLEDNSGVRSGPATVTVTVRPVNDAPVVGNEIFPLDNNTALIIPASQLLANDKDIEGDTLAITEVLNPINGSVILDEASGRVTFTPTMTSSNGGFDYRVSDGQASSIGHVEVIPSPIVPPYQPPIIDQPDGKPPIVENHSPVAVEDTVTLTRDAQILIIPAEQLLDNDSDSDGDALRLTSVSSNPSDGTVTFDKVANEVIFTPHADFATTQIGTFNYTVSDNKGGSATTTVTVIPANESPIAISDSLRVAADQPTVISSDRLTNNDTDADGDTPVITTVISGSRGEVVLASDNNGIIFTPTEEFSQVGQDDFSYTINDGYGGVSSGTVTLIANYSPVATDDHFIISTTDTAITIAVAEVLGNDSDRNLDDILTITTLNDVINGEVFFNTDAGMITFTPNTEFAIAGEGQFTYVVNDGNGATDTAVVTFRFNHPPQPVADDFSITADTTRVFTKEELLQNDTDSNGDTLTIVAVNTPIHGQVSLDVTTQQIAFTPDGDFKTTGEGNFTYTVMDHYGATADAIVTLRSDIVVAGDDEITVTTSDNITIAISDLLANDSSRNHDPLTMTEVRNAVNGEVILNSTAETITFTPTTDFMNSGQGQFTYTVTNGHGDTATATVNLKANTPPVAQADNFIVVKDTPLLIQATELTTNDRDKEGDTLTIESVSIPDHGTAVIHPDGNVEYTPQPGFAGMDQFEYIIHDGHGGQSSAEVILKINTLPQAQDDGITEFNNITLINTPLTIATADLLSNDMDSDGDPLTITEMTPADHGTVTLSGEKIDYSPNPDFVGEDQFTYTVDDGGGGTDTATVTITVEKIPEVIDAIDDTLSEPFNVPVIIPTSELLNNDQNAETITAVQADPNSGVEVRLTGNEILIFVDALVNNQFDSVNFEYTVTNTRQESDTATVTLISSNVIEGTSTDDRLEGSSSIDIVLGKEGNDTFMPSQAPDKLLGGDGDDIFLFNPNTSTGILIDGGAGNDTLRLTMEGQSLDLINNHTLAGEQFNLKGIDAIDLASGHQLKLSINDVLELSDNGKLIVDGSGGSLINSMGQGWIGQGSVIMNDTSYLRYTANSAELLVNQEVFALVS